MTSVWKPIGLTLGRNFRLFGMPAQNRLWKQQHRGEVKLVFGYIVSIEEHPWRFHLEQIFYMFIALSIESSGQSNTDLRKKKYARGHFFASQVLMLSSSCISNVICIGFVQPPNLHPCESKQ